MLESPVVKTIVYRKKKGFRQTALSGAIYRNPFISSLSQHPYSSTLDIKTTVSTCREWGIKMHLLNKFFPSRQQPIDDLHCKLYRIQKVSSTLPSRTGSLSYKTTSTYFVFILHVPPPGCTYSFYIPFINQFLNTPLYCLVVKPNSSAIAACIILGLSIIISTSSVVLD